jgi:hypothetical protein
MTIRQRKEVLETIHSHFVEYNLPREITIEGYTTIVAQPVLRRAIKKNFNNWPRVIRALEIAYPDMFSKVSESTFVEPVKDPLAALKLAKAATVTPDSTDED